jgi:hypothetical protein
MPRGGLARSARSNKAAYATARDSTLLTDFAYQRPPTRRGDAARIQRSGNLVKRDSARALYLANKRQDVCRITSCGRFGGRYRGFASLRELWAAQLHPASLSASPSIARARSDHCAFLLSQSGEKVEDEGVNICTKFSNNELHMLSHEARDEVRSFTPNGR